MTDVSEIMREFDTILTSSKKSLISMSIEDVRVFKALKARLLTDLLTEEVLSRHNLMCLDIPEFEKKPDDSRYFYIFDASKMKNITRDDLEKIVFSTEEVLGVYPSTNHIDAKEDRKKLLKFAKRKFVTLDEMDLGKVLTSVKLNNIRLVIRVSTHNREDIANRLKANERKLERDKGNSYLMDKISRDRDDLARRDARKSLVDPKKYFNVDEREDYTEDFMGVLGKHYGKKRILGEFKKYLNLLNTRSGATVYDFQDLQKFINTIFDKDYESDLEDDRKKGLRKW